MPAMEREHVLPGHLTVRSVDIPAGFAEAIRRSLSGAPTDRTGPVRGRVTVLAAGDGRARRRPERAALTGDAGDGVVASRHAAGLVVEDGPGWSLLTGEIADLTVEVGSGTPGWRVIRDVLRPAVQVAGIDAGTVVAHAASVELAGRGILLAGWSESGKTETALALSEDGALFLGDKWTVIWRDDAGGVTWTAPFPNRVGVRSWVVPWLPKLAVGLPGGRRLRLRTAERLAPAARWVAKGARGSRIADAILAPAADTATLADTIRLSAEDIRAAQSGDVAAPAESRLDTVVLLTTIEPGDDPSIDTVAAADVAGELARSAAYERRRYHLLGERAAFLGVRVVPGFDIVAREARAIERLLGDVRVLRLRSPFPGDPTIAARLIRSAL